MNIKLAKWLLGYGAFLILVGLVGFVSNPAKAKTALLSGGTFGLVTILWAVLVQRGLGWGRVAALLTTGLLTAMLTWRASVAWRAVAEGQSEKLLASSLISLMLLASLVMLPVLATIRPSRLNSKSNAIPESKP